MTFKIEKTVDCTHVLWADAPCELAIKHSLGLQTEMSVPSCNIIDGCFQQSSRANVLRWSQTNVAGNRKERFCKWQRGLCGVRAPLMSAPGESAGRMWSAPSCPSFLWQACTVQRAEHRAADKDRPLLCVCKGRTERLACASWVLCCTLGAVSLQTVWTEETAAKLGGAEPRQTARHLKSCLSCHCRKRIFPSYKEAKEGQGLWVWRAFLPTRSVLAYKLPLKWNLGNSQPGKLETDSK